MPLVINIFRSNEWIKIGPDIFITAYPNSIDKNQTKVVISAPENIKIDRVVRTETGTFERKKKKSNP